MNIIYKTIRVQFFFMLAFIAIYSTYAHASSNTRPVGGGEGVGTISGWNVSNVHYELAQASSSITVVEFDLDGPAGTVMVGFDGSDAGNFECRNNTVTHWVCNLSRNVGVSEVNGLRVIATSN